MGNSNNPAGTGGGVIDKGGVGVSSMLATKKYSIGRGVAPPIPPNKPSSVNKPSVPPKSGTLTAKIHAAKLEQQIT